MFHQSAEQSCGGPPFFIGLFCEARPEGFEGWWTCHAFVPPQVLV